MTIDPLEWDPQHATRVLMDAVAQSVHREPEYKQLAYYWAARDKTISTMSDLLACYYSSVTVVRIPIKGHYMRMEKQIELLYTTITDRCDQSYHTKRNARMLSNADELHLYVQFAFDHFAHDLTNPFNFIETACDINPIPTSFEGNILQLAIAVRDRIGQIDGRGLFLKLSPMVASCIMLDSVRHSRKGALQPPDTKVVLTMLGTAEQLLERAYMEKCYKVLDDFCRLYWPCAFRDRRGRSCCNMREGHIKGHQDRRGTVIGVGMYESSFSSETFIDEWCDELFRTSEEIERQMQARMLTAPDAEKSIMAELHLHSMDGFYRSVGGAGNFVSHSACFCCLREISQHPLPCGHVLCTPCVKDYGSSTENAVSLAYCPFHPHDQTFVPPWKVHLKPELAGARILSLDGYVPLFFAVLYVASALLTVRLRHS